MDPLAHSLAGAALAETGLRRTSALATATLVIGANLPDVDILAYFGGPHVGLAFRRGWTHGILAMVALPLMLTSLVVAYDRWRRRRPWAGRVGRGREGAGGGGQGRDEADAGSRGREGVHARGGAKPRVILALAALAVATHPTLDWLNTYGMRWLMPFDGRWFYGDVLFIVDPWLWLLLGAAVFLARSGSWQSVTGWAILAALASALILGSGAVPPAAKLVWVGGLVIVAAARTFAGRPPAASAAIARGLVAVAVLYIVSMGLAAAAARQRVLDALATRGGLRVERFMVGPVPADPVVRSVVAQTAAAYHLGGFWWLRTPALRVRDSVVRTAADSIVTAASRTPAARAFLGWARFPFAEVEATDSGYTVYFLDARYTRARTSDFGGTAVRLSPTLEPLPY